MTEEGSRSERRRPECVWEGDGAAASVVTDARSEGREAKDFYSRIASRVETGYYAPLLEGREDEQVVSEAAVVPEGVSLISRYSKMTESEMGVPATATCRLTKPASWAGEKQRRTPF